MARKSVTTDELQYIAAGYYHLRTGDFNFNATNPPLMKMIAAVPLLYLAPELPEVRSDPRAWSLPEQWKYARRFLYHNQVDADRMLLAARLPIVAVSLLLGIFVFRWGAALFGALGGCTALFFYALSPNILAHARLATHDLGLTAWMFIACYYFWRFMDRPSVVSLLLCGLFAGLALLTKTTAVFLAPIFGLYVLICMLRAEGKGIFERFPWVRRLDPKLRARRQLLSAGWACCAIAFIVLLVLNAGYGFQGTLRA
ncbi:MAG: glycosyltransferase family 39 protein, partial [Phycisphaerae bacterium]